jgi:hypothetical protein
MRRDPEALASQANPADTKRPEAALDAPSSGLTAEDAMTAHPTAAATAVSRRSRAFKLPNLAADLLGFRKRDANAEAKIQASIVAWVRLVAPDVLIFIFAVPNGGLRTKAEAARMKWTGVLAGVPDLCIIAPGAKVFFIECKTERGSLSADQRRVYELLIALGAPLAIARSVEDARRAFDVWGLPTKEARR